MREISVNGVIDRMGLSVPVYSSMLICSSAYTTSGVGESMLGESGPEIVTTGRSGVGSVLGLAMGSPIGSYSWSLKKTEKNRKKPIKLSY